LYYLCQQVLTINVPVFVDLTQNDAVKDTALAVPFFKYCKFCPSNNCLTLKNHQQLGVASAVVQSNFKEFAKPCPVGTSVDCDIVSKFLNLVIIVPHLSTV
jgi:hypothetical protein